jgi:alpha-N-arabinofuranosidase
MLLTPTYHVYEMYVPHQGATAVRTLIESDEVPYNVAGTERTIPAVSGSASLVKDTLFLTLTHCQADATAEVTLDLLGGAAARGGTARVLSGEIHAHNTFDVLDAVQPEPVPLEVEGRSIVLSLPPASVSAFEVHLA